MRPQYYNLTMIWDHTTVGSENLLLQSFIVFMARRANSMKNLNFVGRRHFEFWRGVAKLYSGDLWTPANHFPCLTLPFELTLEPLKHIAQAVWGVRYTELYRTVSRWLWRARRRKVESRFRRWDSLWPTDLFFMGHLWCSLDLQARSGCLKTLKRCYSNHEFWRMGAFSLQYIRWGRVLSYLFGRACLQSFKSPLSTSEFSWRRLAKRDALYTIQA